MWFTDWVIATMPTYIVETGRNWGYKIDEQRKNVTQICDKKKYTRAEGKLSERVWNQSPITDVAK